jgi:hypothetical protein
VHACHAQIARRANLPHVRGVVEEPKSTAHLRHLASMRGTYRDRHDTWSAGCDGREGIVGRAMHFADGEVVWS